MTMNDAEIIERSFRDPQAFGEIIDRHFDAVVGFCVRRTGNAYGEDIAVTVFRLAF
jgi:DNA-directed RNA polymerase specialized sigma24 family protein